MTCATHHRLLRAPQTQRAMKSVSANARCPRSRKRRAFRKGPHFLLRYASGNTMRATRCMRRERAWLLDSGWWLGRRVEARAEIASKVCVGLAIGGVGSGGRPSSSWMRAGRAGRAEKLDLRAWVGSACGRGWFLGGECEMGRRQVQPQTAQCRMRAPFEAAMELSQWMLWSCSMEFTEVPM